MCGKCTVYLTKEELIDILNRVDHIPAERDAVEQIKMELKTSGDVKPTNIFPVVTSNGFAIMKWRVKWPNSTIPGVNLRQETLLSRLSSKKAAPNTCLIPVTRFFENGEVGKKVKIPYEMRLAGEERFYIAAVWEHEKGSPIPLLSTLTMEAIPAFHSIHPRMSVILPSEAHSAWLGPNQDIPAALAQAVRDVQFKPEGPAQTSFFLQ